MAAGLQILITVAVCAFCIHRADGQCKNMPSGWVGDWFSLESGSDVTTTLDALGNVKVLGSTTSITATCDNIVISKDLTNISDFVWGTLTYKSDAINFGCLNIQQRTPNILEYARTGTQVSSKTDACQNFPPVTVAFRKSPLVVNCRDTFEGVFQFSYEFQLNPGICVNPDNFIVACQEPGSPFKDNQVFTQQYNVCPSNSLSSNSLKEWQCMGSWRSSDPTKQNYIYGGIMDRNTKVDKDRFRCLLTTDNQQLLLNQRRWTKSDTATCGFLINDYQGPERLIITPRLSRKQLQQIAPSCNLPRNMSGTWFTSSQYDSNVIINSTHIHFTTLYSTFEYVETYFTCQQSRDTRYLMKQVTVGRCEVDYVCFEFLPRQQNVVRFRMGKPYRPSTDVLTTDTTQIFRRACSWNSFTISRPANVNYLYQTFLLNPPAAVNCPIGGIYKFQQLGNNQSFYRTKIRGVTDRPRVSITCLKHESEFKVCSGDTTTVSVDVERCAAVDNVGRPLGEYDVPDNYLQCVGFWNENQKSYLVTYDTEDPVVKFRCWVYERMDWKDLHLSRALRAACHPDQKPTSYNDSEGASMAIVLMENEREFDQCPQTYLDGRDPDLRTQIIYVVGGATVVKMHTVAIGMLTLLSFSLSMLH